MFAVIQIGGKQYKVHNGSKFAAEKIDAEVGASLVFNDVVLYCSEEGKTEIGAPFVSGCSVSCIVKSQKRAEKLIVSKKRRRKNSRRKTGHRQRITILEVTSVEKK